MNTTNQPTRNDAYRGTITAAPRERKRLLQHRLREMAAVPQGFYLLYQRRVARDLSGWLALAGICAVGLCLGLGAGLPLVLGADWLLIALAVVLSGWLSRRRLALQLETFLRVSDDVHTDLSRLDRRLPGALLSETSGRVAWLLNLGLALFLVVSFLVAAAALPGSSVPVFLLAFLVSSSLVQLPQEKTEGSAWLFLRWALLAWIMPAGVLALIVAGSLFASNLVVAVGLGFLFGRWLLRQTKEEELAWSVRGV